MPKLALALVIVAALAAGLFFSGILEPEAAPPARVDAAGGAPARTELDVADGDVVAPQAGAELAVRRTTEPNVEVPAATATDEAPCIVVGRFVDADERPLPGILVQLGAWKDWSAAGDASALATFRGWPTSGMVGFEERTDPDGAFRFEVSVPTTEGCSLYAAGDRFRDSYSERFGYADARSRAPLTAGLLDLGTIQLAATGALFGRVTDANGTPLEGVRLSVGPSKSSTYSRDAVSGADGRFVTAHAPVGTYGVSAKLEGYLSVFQEPHTVEAGRDTGPVDFVLERAPTISGRVVDTEGRPIEGARVGGWPESSGSGAWVKTAADGTFEIALPENERYTLGAKHPEYATWGDENDRNTLFDSGTSGLEIALAPAEKTRFRVVSAVDGAPLERFGLAIYPGEGSASPNFLHTERRRPPLVEHPGGAVEAKASEGVDRVLVWAEGYLLTEVDVEHDEDAEGTQTLALEVGATITGRVVDDGVPVAGAPVEVTGMRRSNGAVDGSSILRGTTDADGRFAIGGVARGIRTLTVRPPGETEIVRELLQPEPPETLDVGELEVVAGGTIAGVCVFPAGIDPAGLTLYLDGWQKGVSQTTDSAGRFRFENVAPGQHEVSSDDRPGVLDGGATVRTQVESGETANVELDLSDRLLQQVEIELVSGDFPLEGARVQLIPIAEPGATAGTRRTISLGAVDANGVAQGFASALGPCSLHLAGRIVGHFRVPDVVVDLDGSGPVRMRIELEFASAALTLPAAATLPTDGMLDVRVEGLGDDGRKMRVVRLPLRDRALEAGPVAAHENGVLTVHGLVPGATRISVAASVKDAPRVQTDLGDGRFSMGPEQLWSGSAEAKLVAGEVTQVTLR